MLNNHLCFPRKNWLLQIGIFGFPEPPMQVISTCCCSATSLWIFLMLTVDGAILHTSKWVLRAVGNLEAQFIKPPGMNYYVAKDFCPRSKSLAPGDPKSGSASSGADRCFHLSLKGWDWRVSLGLKGVIDVHGDNGDRFTLISKMFMLTHFRFRPRHCAKHLVLKWHQWCRVQLWAGLHGRSSWAKYWKLARHQQHLLMLHIPWDICRNHICGFSRVWSCLSCCVILILESRCSHKWCGWWHLFHLWPDAHSFAKCPPR